jgi:hypothetical protein
MGMDFSTVRWTAVLACVVFSMISGSIWFGPKTFFPVWWKAIGKTATDKPHGQPATWGLLIGSSALQATFMALMVNSLGRAGSDATLVSGATTGFVLCFGFVAPASLSNKLFPGYLRAWAIEAGNHLINYVAFGAILGAWH